MKHSKLSLSQLLTSIFVLGAATFSPLLSLPVSAQTADATEPLPDNARFSAEINAFQTHDKRRKPREGAVLFLGSSSVRLWDSLRDDFAELPIIKRGFGGSEISDSVAYAERIAIPYKPKIIVLFAGTNDIGNSHKSAEQVAKDFEAFVAKIHAALPETRIAFISISPTVARWKQEDVILEANRLIEKWISNYASPTRKVSFIDTHARLLGADGQPRTDLLQQDGLHLNDKGYQVLTALIKPQIMALVSQDEVQRLDAPANKPAAK